MPAGYPADVPDSENGESPMRVDLDQAIADWLLHQTQQAMHRLVELGPAVLRRAVEIYYGGTVPDVVRQAQASRPARTVVDAWAMMLGGLGQIHPQLYLGEIEDGRVHMGGSPTLEIVTLGSIDLPRAAELLRRYRAHPDWLVRLHVVTGLGRRPDRESNEAVEAAITDVEQEIRDEAARWLQRRDPDRARALYQHVLADSGLPPALRAELTKRVSVAKRLATVRHRRANPAGPDAGKIQDPPPTSTPNPLDAKSS